MKVISLIPSITETLIECGVEVVARTRYCIHPKEKVQNIPVIGGTKSVDWEKAPEADLVILDKEENSKEMAESCPFGLYVMHICSLEDLENSLFDLSKKLGAKKMEELSQDLGSINSLKPNEKQSLKDFPGALKLSNDFSSSSVLNYVIWKNPYMRIGENTFIASMIEKLGYRSYFQFEKSKYAEFSSLEALDGESFLFSSEPYPFAREFNELASKYPCALVDGESYSWYGIRAIRFLQKFV